MAYEPVTIADLAERLIATPDPGGRWKYVWEFLEEYRWASADRQAALLTDEPALTADQRWDVLLAADRRAPQRAT